MTHSHSECRRDDFGGCLHHHRKIFRHVSVWRVAGMMVGILITLLNSPASAGTNSVGDTIDAFGQDRIVARVDSGLLIVDGVALKRPYTISTVGEQILVNEVPFEGVVRREDVMMTEVEPAPPKLSQEELRQQTPNRLKELLCGDGIVIAFDDHPALTFVTRDEKFNLQRLLLGDPMAAAETQSILKLPARMDAAPSTQQWLDWVANFVPDPETNRWLRQQVDRAIQVESRNKREIAAVTRLTQAAYPLTMLGMILGVLSLGQLIQWTAHQNVAIESAYRSPRSIRSVKIVLLLVFAMSALDLTWTLLAISADRMTELNPLATPYVKTPLALCGFKIVSTTIGVGLLFVTRRQRISQMATWWICLVLVLVTFRWAVFNSLFV